VSTIPLPRPNPRRAADGFGVAPPIPRAKPQAPSGIGGGAPKGGGGDPFSALFGPSSYIPPIMFGDAGPSSAETGPQTAAPWMASPFVVGDGSSATAGASPFGGGGDSLGVVVIAAAAVLAVAAVAIGGRR
jgi:hypothetical protein